MKTLVVYYSRTGCTKEVGDAIAKILEADIEVLKDTKNRNGIIGWLRAGRDASMKKPAEIEKTKKDPSKYDIVIIGTPVWAGNMTPAVRTYLTQNGDKLKEVAFFCTMGGNDPRKVFESMSELCDENPAEVLMVREKELKNEEHAKKIIMFSEGIKNTKKT